MGSGSYLNQFCNFLAFVVPSGECARTENSLHVAKFPSVGTENSATFRPPWTENSLFTTLISVPVDGK